MKRIIDKSVLLLICTMSLFFGASDISCVAAVLIAVSVSAVVQLYSGKLAASVLIAAYCALCGAFPVFLCFVPVLLYDALCEKRWYLILPAITAVAADKPLNIGQYAVTAAACAAAVLIYLRVSKLEETLSAMTELRDTTESENLRLERRNRQLSKSQDSEVHIATLRERNRIAREIHDNVGHMLTRSLLQAGALIIINKDEKMKEPLESLKSTLDTAMTSIRESVHDLHDDSIDMKKVVDEAIASVDGRFTVDLDYDMGRGVPGNVKLCIIGVVREGLSNAVKHSDGDRISIILREHPAFYQLMLTDNGHCSEIRESGIGLSDMEDRAASVGGKITFTPSADGFRIFMSIPKE